MIFERRYKQESIVTFNFKVGNLSKDTKRILENRSSRRSYGYSAPCMESLYYNLDPGP